MGQERIARAVRDHVACMESGLLAQAPEILRFAARVVDMFHRGGRLLVCGSGPLAAVADLTANRFLHRLSLERPQLPSVALGGNYLLAHSLVRDGLQRQIYARQLQVFGAPGDVLLLFAEGQRDETLIEALQQAHQIGCPTAALFPARTEPFDPPPDFRFPLETESPARLAEAALFFGQLLCELVEAELFGISN